MFGFGQVRFECRTHDILMRKALHVGEIPKPLIQQRRNPRPNMYGGILMGFFFAFVPCHVFSVLFSSFEVKRAKRKKGTASIFLMDQRKKINVNLTEDEFRSLDSLRAQRGEKWQSLLLRLLTEWADGPVPEPRPSPRAEMDPVVLAIAELLSKPGNVEKLRAILLTFVNQQGQNSP